MNIDGQAWPEICERIVSSGHRYRETACRKAVDEKPCNASSSGRRVGSMLQGLCIARNKTCRVGPGCAC